jgi:hypothetical protein
MLGELSIVVIPEHGRREQFKPDTEFLSSVDERIMEASKRNDDLDQDEFFSKSPLSDAQAAVSEDYEFEPMENKKTKDIFSKHSNDEAYSASGPGLSKESMKGYDEQSEESAAKDPLDDDDDKVDL